MNEIGVIRTDWEMLWQDDRLFVRILLINGKYENISFLNEAYDVEDTILYSFCFNSKLFLFTKCLDFI